MRPEILLVILLVTPLAASEPVVQEEIQTEESFIELDTNDSVLNQVSIDITRGGEIYTEIVEIDTEEPGLDIYRSYNLSVEGANVTTVTVDLDIEESWIEENGYADWELSLFTRPGLRHYSLDNSTDSYSASFNEDGVFMVAVPEESFNSFVLARDGEGSCSVFLEVPEGFEQVDSCDERNYSVFIIPVVAVLAAVTLVAFWIHRKRSVVDRLNSLTRQTVKGMEEGSVPEDKEVLEELEEANEEAYKGHMGKASKLLEDAVSRLKRKK